MARKSKEKEKEKEPPAKKPRTVKNPYPDIKYTVPINLACLSTIAEQWMAEFKYYYKRYLQFRDPIWKDRKVCYMPAESWYTQVDQDLCEKFSCHIYVNSETQLGSDIVACVFLYGQHKCIPRTKESLGSEKAKAKFVEGTILQTFYLISGSTGTHYFGTNQADYLKLKVPPKSLQSIRDVPWEIIRTHTDNERPDVNHHTNRMICGTAKYFNVFGTLQDCSSDESANTSGIDEGMDEPSDYITRFRTPWTGVEYPPTIVLINNIPLTYNEFHLLAADKCLNDLVIDAYFTLIRRRQTDLTILSAPTTFWQKLATLNESEMQNLVTTTSIGDRSIYRYHRVLIPIILIDKKHWVLAVLNTEDRHITLYDSIKGMNNNHVLSRIYTYIKVDAIAKDMICHSWRLKFADVPQQGNNYDCGVFCCIMAERIARGVDADQFDFTQDEIPQYREKIIHELLNEKLNKE